MRKRESLVKGAAGGTPAPWARRRHRLLWFLAAVCVALLPAVVWRLRLASDVRAQIAALEWRGHPVNAAQLSDSLPEVADGDNAAVLYFEAAEQYAAVAGAVPLRFPFAAGAMPDPSLPLGVEEVEALRALVDANTETLRLLRRAAERPRARYIERYGVGDVLRLHVERLVPLAEVLHAEALVLASEGKVEGALRTLGDSLALCRSLEGDRLRFSLLHQWSMEHQLLDTLEQVLNRCAPLRSDIGVEVFAAYFSPATRRGQLRAMIATERAQFIVRIREGRDRGVFKNTIITAGLGDLNIQAYLDGAALMESWIDALPGEKDAIEVRYDEMAIGWARHPFLFVTLQRYGVPSLGYGHRRELDRAAVVEVALAALDSMRTGGGVPQDMQSLVLQYLPEAPPELAAGGAIVLDVEGPFLEVSNGLGGDDRIRFRVPLKG